MSPRSTTVYEVWTALVDLLESVDFGAHPANPGGTLVHFGFPDDDVELGYEHVVVIGGIEGYDQEQRTFAKASTSVGRRRESYSVLVLATSAVPGATRREVNDRLEYMTGAIEAAVRGARFAPSSSPRPEVDGVDWWHVTAHRPLIVGTRNGHIGRDELTISVLAHI